MGASGGWAEEGTGLAPRSPSWLLEQPPGLSTYRRQRRVGPQDPPYSYVLGGAPGAQGSGLATRGLCAPPGPQVSSPPPITAGAAVPPRTHSPSPEIAAPQILPPGALG